MRKAIMAGLALAALGGTAAAPAQAAPASTQGLAPAGTQAPAAFVPWNGSVEVCLGKKKTRKAISALNHGKAAYAYTSLGLGAVPGFWSALLKAGAVVDGFVAKRWATDTAKAYIHSHRRGAYVRVGFVGFGPAKVPWWDARKRGAKC